MTPASSLSGAAAARANTHPADVAAAGSAAAAADTNNAGEMNLTAVASQAAAKSEDSLTAARRRIAAAYDPALLGELGSRLAPLLAEHLRSVQNRESPVLPWTDPRDLSAVARRTLAEAGTASEHPDSLGDPQQMAAKFTQQVQLALRHGHNLHHPRYVGHQVPAPVPWAGWFDALGAITNQPMAVYEMGPWATSVERALVAELGGMIGWAEGSFAGIVTHGASLANLTALIAARNISMPGCWENGFTAGAPALVVQADAHYCIARAAGIIGLGTAQVLKAALDTRRRMDPQQLDEQLQRLAAAGRQVIAVCACACATPTGAFDPLTDIAAVCRRHDVWLHVDGAHGGGVLLSERHRSLMAGAAEADSLTWDAHKMMFVPALCAFLFYKNPRHSYEAFKQNAPYLFDATAPGLAEFDGGLRTVECTKRPAAFPLWGVWTLCGRQIFADLVDVTFELTQEFHRKLAAAPDFVPLHQPQANIQVFRHIPERLKGAPPHLQGEFQARIRREVIESGRFYLVTTTIDGQTALRTTLINPLTTPDDLDALLDALREAGNRIEAENH